MVAFLLALPSGIGIFYLCGVLTVCGVGWTIVLTGALIMFLAGLLFWVCRSGFLRFIFKIYFRYIFFSLFEIL